MSTWTSTVAGHSFSFSSSLSLSFSVSLLLSLSPSLSLSFSVPLRLSLFLSFTHSPSLLPSLFHCRRMLIDRRIVFRNRKLRNNSIKGKNWTKVFSGDAGRIVCLVKQLQEMVFWNMSSSDIQHSDLNVDADCDFIWACLDILNNSKDFKIAYMTQFKCFKPRWMRVFDSKR